MDTSLLTTAAVGESNRSQPLPDDGDWAYWDQFWRAGERFERMLYCPGEPTTLRQLVHRAYFDDLWQLLPRGEKSRCVELGAGRGTMAMYLSRQKCDVWMVDLSSTALDTALGNYSQEQLPRPNIVEADVRDTRLPSESFDCVCSTGLLEHFQDPLPVLKESLRLLRRGGLLFHIIVAAIDRRRSLPLRAVMNPIGVTRSLLKQVAKPLFKPTARPTAEALRTTFSPARWLAWMRDLGQAGAVCQPYNPLHSLYRSPFWQRRVSLPLWKSHIARRRKRSRFPLLATSASLAQCQLLVTNKR